MPGLITRVARRVEAQRKLAVAGRLADPAALGDTQGRPGERYWEPSRRDESW